MRTARLIRFRTDTKGTHGIIVLDTGHRYLTIEPELNDNYKSISCIPTGQYEVDWEPSSKYGACYWVKDVAGRSYIKIHSGNTEDDTEGCIILGLGVALTGVKSSKAAVSAFENTFRKQSFRLTIVDSY